MNPSTHQSASIDDGQGQGVPENPAAFPYAAEYGHPAACGGMSLRDYFAGQVLPTIGDEYDMPEDRARAAYAVADAMLAERERKS